jgi:AmmeMemoRadiSam system protein B
MFYPDLPEVLSREVAALLAARSSSSRPLPDPADSSCSPIDDDAAPGRAAGGMTEGCPKALIVPHAGYVYSGPIAASAFSLLARSGQAIDRVVLLGPTHRIAIRGLALPDCDAFSTPLGDIPIDRTAVDALRDLPQVVTSVPAHRQEHSLEVELPFLRIVLGDFSLVPLAVGDVSAEAVAQVLDRLWGGPETLIVVSSDLSHYLPYQEARRVDAETARRIVLLDPLTDHRQACGAAPINGLLAAARRRGMKVELLDLRNSGDTAGDHRRVVGYGAFAFFESPERRETREEEVRHVH